MEHQPSRRQAVTRAAGLAATLGLASTACASTDRPPTEAAHSKDVAALMRRMSLEEKVGQLFIVEVYGQAANTAHAKNRELYGVDTPAEVIAKYRPGGVLYFDARRGPDNLKTPRQIAELSNGLQDASRLPLIISTDQEGGSVVYRLTAPATLLPGNMALGATRSTDDAHASTRIIATELAAVGLNQNYAPVADVNINPDNPVIGVRSFGADPTLCVQLVGAAVAGHHRGGVASAAKHFPGHGDTGEDSHYKLPKVTHSRAELERIDLPPFRAAIRADVDTIMTAHVVVPALDDSGVPATMSHRIITGLLREELGFDGLIVTDALDMAGATEDFPPDVAPVRALQAGCDQLVLAPQMDVAYQAVLDAVRCGELSERRIDASVRRVLEHKLRRNLFTYARYVSAGRAERLVGASQYRRAAQKITDRSVTLVRNVGQVLPLESCTRRVFVTGWGADNVKALTDAIGQRDGQRATSLETGAVPAGAKVQHVVAEARCSDLVIVCTNVAAAGSEGGTAQAALVKELAAAGTPVVAVAVRNPYDLRLFPSVAAYLATYSYGGISMESVARVLYGEHGPCGRLPVAITAVDDPDSTLYPLGHGLRY